MLSDRERFNILKRVQNGELSPEQGLGLIKKAIASPADAMLLVPEGSVYYTTTWQEQALSVPGAASRVENIILFADENSFPADKKGALEQEERIKIILILPGAQYAQEAAGVFRINPHVYKDYQRLFKQLTDQGQDCSRLIHYWSTHPFRSLESSVREALELGMYSLFRITRALMELKVKQEIALVYCYENDRHEAQHPLFAAAGGFARTLQLENPRYKYKTVGIRKADSTDMPPVRELIKEFDSIKTEVEVCYRNNKRYVRNFTEAVAAGTNPVVLKTGGTYLIAGGAGGLGLIFAEYIGSKVKANLALTGRSALSPDKQRKIDSIRQAGIVVEYFQGDIADPEASRELLINIKKRFGKIDGIINSAGINQDAFIIKKEQPELERVIRPKILGTLNLDALTRQESLDFFILFSSITGAVGNTGQGDYAFANSFLDYFAFYREQLRAGGECSGKTLSINWPLWEAGGMQVDAASRELLKRTMGMDSLKTNDGLAAFEQMLLMEYAQVGIVTGAREKILQRLGIPAGSPAVVSPVTEKVVPVTNMPGKDKKVSRDEVEGQLLAICSELLKVNSTDMDCNTELVEYGLGSIMMIALLNRIEKLYGDTIAPNAIADYPTISLLAGHLIGSGIVKSSVEDGEAPSLQEQAAGNEAFAENKNNYPGFSSAAAINARFLAQEDNKAPLYAGKGMRRQDNKVAVISMACRMPQSAGPGEFWEHLKNGRDLIRETPPERWDVKKYYAPEQKGTHTSYSKWAGYIDDIDLFDAAFFGIPDESALILDPQHRIILELSQELIDRAGYTRKTMDNSRTSVYIGANESAYIYRYWDQIPGEYLKNVVVNRIQNMMAARVADFFNLRGPALTIDTACSSSLVAVHEACRAILEKEVDMAIVGGVDLIIGEYYHIGFSQSGALSREPRSYVFDERAGGFVLGEGAGMVLLKDYAQAVADGDPISAVILGSAVNNDGHTMGLTVPDLEGQQEVIKTALQASGIDPGTITYYEAHGTGTLLGDPIEIKAATTVFKEYTSKLNYCAVGSVKTNIGHLLRAAGIAGLLKILLSMEHHYIPPSLNCERPHPRFKFNTSPFYPVTSLTPWNPENGVRRAAISSFGFGGTNAHVILEEFDRQQSDYALKHKPLPVTRFNRKRYWIGKPVEAVNRGSSGEQDMKAMLEMLSRGELTVEQMMALENAGQGV